MKLLDCTLRDGGYYNDWNFDNFFIKKYSKSCELAGVDIIELGYISLNKDLNICKNVNDLDKELKLYLSKFKMQYAFMIDMKEFKNISESKMNLFLDEIDSDFFSLMRIAVDAETLEDSKTLEFINKIKNRHNIEIAINLMYASKVNIKRMVSICKIYEAVVDTFYIADSFGAILPSEIVEILSALKKFKISIGVHFHDNLGLAFANAIESIKMSVDYIDSTVTGMGRGVGNLKTEQLLCYLQHKLDRKEFDLLHLEEIRLELMQEKLVKKWGWDIDFMTSGCINTHQKNVIKLRETGLTTKKIVKSIAKG